MQIIPEQFDEMLDELQPSEQELKLVKSLAGAFRDDPALLLLKIKPVPEVKVDLCLIHERLGIFFIFTRENVAVSREQALFTNQMTLPIIFEKVAGRLKTHRQLIDSKGNLKFPVGMLFYFPEYVRNVAGKSDFIVNHCIFSDDLSNSVAWAEKLIASVFNQAFDFSGFSKEDLSALHYAIVPEYRLPKFDIDRDYELIDSEMFPINQPIELVNDQNVTKQFKALALTKAQIDFVNKVKYGPDLILSGAGSGKTVLLIARAFKVAKTFEGKNVLLTCFNRGLSQYIDECLDVAGMRSRNLMNRTFYGLCRYLLEVNNIDLPTSQGDQFFKDIFTKAREALDSGKIKSRFFAIFVDEVQDFKREWIEFLFKLLEDRNKYIVNLCGDKTQDIRKIISISGVPWQSPLLPDFESSKRHVKSNFRFTKAVGKYINLFCEHARDVLNELQMNVAEDKDLFIENKPKKRGKSKVPQVFWVENYEDEIRKVVHVVRRLKEKFNVPYTEIAVVYPYKKSADGKYRPFHYLRKALVEENIPYTVLGPENSYSYREGVVVSTIHSVKGLEFRAVILFGLAKFEPSSVSNKMNHYNKQKILENIKLLYTALTRAEEFLGIVLLKDKKDSVYASLLEKPIKRLKREKIKR